MQKEQSIFNQQGFSLVEALLAVAIFALGVTAFTGAIIYGQQSTAVAGSRSRATFLAEEGLEAARNIRDADFTNLVDGTYGVSSAGNSWTLTGASDTKDIYTRQVQVQTVDTNRKRITSTVTWQQTAQRSGSIALDTYLTYWQKAVSAWNNPGIASTFDLSSGNSGNGTVDPTAIAISGNFLYVGRTNSAGKELTIFNVSNPAAPALVGSRDLNGTPNDIVISGNYAYIASTDNSTELQIVDISTPSSIANAGKLTSVNLTNANSNSNNNDAIALAITGSYLVMVRDGGDELLIFNLANPANPGAPVGRSSSLKGTPTDVEISQDGNTAYVSSGDDSGEIQGFSISSKTSPSYIGAFNIDSGDNTADALSVAVIDNTYILVGRASSAAPELYTFDTSNYASPLVSSLELGFSINSIALDRTNNNGFLSTLDPANDFQVVNTATPNNLSTAIGSANIANSPVKIVYDSTLNRVFAVDTDDTNELVVIQPN